MSQRTAAICPDKSALARVMKGELAGRDADAVAEHLRSCSMCAETVRNLRTTDTLAEALRDRPVHTDDHADSVRVDELIERLMSIRPEMADAGSVGTLPEADGPTSEQLDRPSGRATQGEPTTEASYGFLAPAEQPDEIGRLGPYRVLRLIGSGGMGIVFEAEDPALGRRVALKVMNPVLAANESDRRRFLREARATAAIEHDHIVPIYQVGEDRNVPYLAMQSLRGETLEARLARLRRLDVQDALRVGREIALGLAAAHARGLIHRDVKPANVWLEDRSRHAPRDASGMSPPPHSPATFVSKYSGQAPDRPSHAEREGYDARVKILDFGLARFQKDELGISQTCTIAGTPAYMAPEQAQGDEVDCRADLFSLGCLLYRALTGELPFQGVNAFAVLVEVTGRDPKPPRFVNPGIPTALEGLIMKLLEKDPAKRYQSASEVAADLAGIERDKSLRSGGAGTTPQVRPRWMAPALVAIAAIVLAIIAYVAGSQILRIRTPHGTIVLELDFHEADGAEVFVDEQHRMTVKLRGEAEPISIDVDPGTHKLRVVKAGFEVFTRDFSLKAGKREQINVRLEPAGEAGVADVASQRVPAAAPSRAKDTNAAPPITPSGPGTEAATAILAGLVPQPAAVPGFRRWQYEARLPRGEVVALAWDPDGRRIACGSPSGNVRVLDAVTSELLQFIPAHTRVVRAIDWSRDGQRVVTAADDGVARLHDLSGGPQRDLDRHSGRIMTVAFSPDDSWVALAGWDSAVRLCRTSGQLGPWLQGHASQTNAVAWHPNGDRLASGSWDGTVRLWDRSGSAGPVLKAHEGGVLAVAWSLDGELLASAGVDGTIRLWTSDGAERAVLRAHSGSVTMVGWSGGDVLATGGHDETVRFWQRDGTLLNTCKLDIGRILALAWTRDGSRLAVSGDKPGILFLDQSGESMGSIAYAASSLRSIVWNRSGQLATAGDDTTVRVWNDDGTQKSIFKGHTPRAWRVSWDPTGTRLVSGGSDGTLRVRNQSGEIIETRSGYHPVAWNPTSDDMAWGIGHEVRMATPGSEIRVLRGHKSIVGWMNWNADGSQLASIGLDGEIRLWGRDGSPGPVMQTHPSSFALAWHPKQPLFAVANVIKRDIQIWRADGTLRESWDGQTVNGALAWSPSGDRLLSCGVDQTVRVWTRAGIQTESLPGPMSIAGALDWNSAGTRIATAHADGVIRAWDGRSYQPLWTSLLFNDGEWVRFDPSGESTAGDPSILDRQLVVVAEDDRGVVQLLKPSQFREHQHP